MSGYNDPQWNKNFKIPKRKNNEPYNGNYNNTNANFGYNSENSTANNSYYEYYNQYSQAQWQQTTAYPQQYYTNQASGKYYGIQAANASTANSVDAVTQNICNTLSNIKEKPKNYQKNIFRETVPDVGDPTLPKELTIQFQPLYCKLCTAQLSSNVMAKLHYKSKNHEKKIRKFLQEYAEKTNTALHPRAKAVAAPKTELESDPKWFHCADCDLPLTGKMHAESHYMGKNHLKVIMGQKRPAGRGYYNDEGKWIRQTSTKRTALKDGEDTFGMEFKKPKLEEASAVSIPAPPQPAQPAPLSKFICSICNVGTTCQEQLDIHFHGQKHMKKLKSLGALDVTIAEPQVAPASASAEVDLNLSVYRTPSGDFYCPICNRTMSSGVQFKVHIKSKQHCKKNGPSPARKDLRSNDYYCPFCNVSLSTDTAFKEHIKGKQHLKKIKKDAEASAEFFCPLCNVTLASSVQFELHINSKLHVNNVSIKKES